MEGCIPGFIAAFFDPNWREKSCQNGHKGITYDREKLEYWEQVYADREAAIADTDMVMAEQDGLLS